MEGVAEFNDVTLVYSSTAGLSLLFYTEPVGGSLSLAATLAFPSTGGATARATKTLPLTGLIGKTFKVKIASAGVFALFAGHIQARQIGTILDGAAGEIWETQPMALGV